MIHGHLPSQAVSGQQVEVVMQGMHRFCIRACAVAAAGVALGTGAVTAASASGGGSAASGPAGIAADHGGSRFASHVHATGPATATPISNRTFAGYQTAVPAGSATVLTAGFTVPALSCTTVDLAIAPSTGVLVNSYRSVSAAFVFTGCLNGAAVYYPGLVVNGTETDYTASPFAAGDVIALTTKVSTNRTRVQVTDVTTGVTQNIIGPPASASAAFVGDEALLNSSGALMHVPNFGKLQFKNCLLDGKSLASWRPQAYQRVNSVGTLQIATGGFWPGGTAFTTRYEHS